MLYPQKYHKKISLNYYPHSNLKCKHFIFMLDMHTFFGNNDDHHHTFNE